MESILATIAHRTETGILRAHCFKVMELVLRAQAAARGLRLKVRAPAAKA